MSIFDGGSLGANSLSHMCQSTKRGKGFSNKPLDLHLCIKRRWISLNMHFSQIPNSTIHVIIITILCISTYLCLLKTNQNNSLCLIIIWKVTIILSIAFHIKAKSKQLKWHCKSMVQWPNYWNIFENSTQILMKLWFVDGWSSSNERL